MLFSIIFVAIHCFSYYWVLVDAAPKQSYLVRVVDLHYVELLDYFLVQACFALFEVWNNFLTEVNGDDVIQLTKRFDFSVCL